MSKLTFRTPTWHVEVEVDILSIKGFIEGRCIIKCKIEDMTCLISHRDKFLATDASDLENHKALLDKFHEAVEAMIKSDDFIQRVTDLSECGFTTNLMIFSKEAEDADDLSVNSTPSMQQAHNVAVVNQEECPFVIGEPFEGVRYVEYSFTAADRMSSTGYIYKSFWARCLNAEEAYLFKIGLWNSQNKQPRPPSQVVPIIKDKEYSLEQLLNQSVTDFSSMPLSLWATLQNDILNYMKQNDLIEVD
ncbi:hypothetical protein [Neptuniibacter sp. QD37_11]|uniref:hypothetical protein n=1 Tax=Neptuniibacter sp. QD37_11 TaxID=3398209 RepID=UPI0039F5BC46